MASGYNKWWQFALYFFINVLASIGLAFLFYYFFGKEIYLSGPHLEVDFFNTVCGIFTILGLGITIFQLTALKRESFVRSETAKTVSARLFKTDNIGRVESAVYLIKELDDLVANTDPNETSIQSLISKADQVIDVYIDIDNHQIIAGCETVIDCKKCVTSLEELKLDFKRILDEKTFGSYSRNYFSSKTKTLKKLTGECEVAIKSN